MNETTLPRVTPYRGEEPYIFISYCHKDSARVLPILAELISRGYRIWYDEGIDPGTEWDEMIATRLMDSAYFIPFITENYLASENCMDELHLAREETLRRFLVYLEEVNLPPAQRMRLGRIQNIHMYTYQNDEDFYDKFSHADGLSVCKSEAESSPDSRLVTVESEAESSVPIINPTDFEIDQNGCLTKYTGPGGDVVIPNGVTEIGESAFENCTSLTSVIIPDGVTEIGSHAFCGCTGLVSITIPKSITQIGSFSFLGCTNLTSITIPDSVTKIGDCAFLGCASLTIHAPSESYAIKYAIENYIAFVTE